MINRFVPVFLASFLFAKPALSEAPVPASTAFEKMAATPIPTPEPSGHFHLDPLNPAVEKDLLLRAFEQPSDFKEPPRLKGEPQLVEPWKGNSPELWADNGVVTVVLSSVASSDNRKELKLSFDFKQDGVVVKSNRVANSELASGLNLQDTDGKTVIYTYLDTGNQYGLAFAMPPISNPRGSLLRVGLLVCPRPRADTKSANSKNEAVGKTDLFLDRIEFDSSAYARGKLISGVSPGRASAAVLTTENIPKGELSSDEAYSSDPEAAVEYHPDATDTLEPVGDESQFSGGIMAIVDLHNSAGYRRVTTVQDVFTIKLVDNVEAFTTQDSNGNKVKIGAGQCYEVFDEKKAFNVFSKETLVIPADKLPNESLSETPTPTPRVIKSSSSSSRRRIKFKWSLKKQ